MEEQLVSFKTAKLAKEKGFLHVRVSDYYQHNGELECWVEGETFSNDHFNSPHFVENYAGAFVAPPQSLLQKWLRDEQNIHIEVSMERTNVFFSFNNVGVSKNQIGHGKTYEAALEDGLYYGLNLIKLTT